MSAPITAAHMAPDPHSASIPPAPLADDKLLELGRQALTTEAQAVSALVPRLDGSFVKACRLCLDCKGRVVVTGMGKSGHVGSKIAATLASTGTPAFFLHPAEAGHGDIGMITRQDVVLAISNSGETAEIITLVPHIRRLGTPLITFTGNADSTLARAATVNVDVSVPAEACPLNLAPTASTTATLAMGDALAVALLKCRGFTEQDFARSHPGGSLGRRLLLHVEDVMRTGKDVPMVTADTPLAQGLMEMSRKALGMTTIVDDRRRMVGIFT
ncbi:MAG TPA: KpsF/GutQ family sugar-phosphate isomerase, partial [Steroidobacteraceae bacterium]|nr:KpsF/GutQ family sugar-phosphate isomerase [Steroidobacteraceae bacterium]